MEINPVRVSTVNEPTSFSLSLDHILSATSGDTVGLLVLDTTSVAEELRLWLSQSSSEWVCLASMVFNTDKQQYEWQHQAELQGLET